MILKSCFQIKNKANMSLNKSKQRYQKMDHVNHVLHRPDTYLGSIRFRKIEEYVATKVKDEYKIDLDTICSCPAILRIFVEPLSNALDNVVRSTKSRTKCTTIKINIDQKTGLTSVWNDGCVVPIEKHPEENCYIHSMIFGQLMTGSNYDDDEERQGSGRNGLGIKLLSIFSTYFKVKGLDPKRKKTLSQVWKNNMKDTEGPVVKSCASGLKGYTEVSWIPDFERFGIKGYTPDIIRLYTKYVIDAAMISKVDMYLNDQLINVSTLREYAKLYTAPTEDQLYIKTKDCEVLVTPSGGNYEHVSFVNGVYTRLGGLHVDAWTEDLFRPIVDKFNGNSKSKKPTINIRDVKQFFRIFVNATVVNPEFNSQDKEKLEAPTVTATVKRTHIAELNKWTVIDDIQDIIRSKEMAVLKKTERGRKKNIKVDGFDKANNAGGRYSDECILVLCEGLSAKTYVVAGIDQGVYGKTGRDWFGIYPLTGKIKNVRNAAPKTIAANKVITNLIQILGLRYDVDYREEKNFKTLQYGKVIITTDADVDGIHIEGLIMNFFHSLFPTVLQRDKPFISSMKTPIARVFVPRKEDILFYDERRFNSYLASQDKKVKAKYYKGLGTTKPEDVPDTFGLKMVEYVNDEKTSHNMNKVFHTKYADARKEWLEEYSPEKYEFSLDDVGKTVEMTVSNFLDGEMIKFSHDDCKRSIPSAIDGLKESQRKILFAARKRNLRYGGESLKVAQFGAYTAEHSAYHHGEQNLYQTVVKMANEFPGTNNIPLLYRDGMFGSRLEGGEDAASARYIFTKLDMLTEYIFRVEDDPLLTHRNVDGQLVEPEHYVPIIPMLCVNGCAAGIGTGWSCNVPCFNPLDLVNAIKIWLENDGEVLLEDPDDGSVCNLLPEIHPWYRSFKGNIEKDEGKDGRYISYGLYQDGPRNTTEIIELPVGMWTSKFKEFCQDLITEKKLKSMKNYSSPKEVKFVVTEEKDFECNVDTLKLYSYLYTSNMVAFNHKDQLKKFESVDDIITSFCEVRYLYYQLRKKHMISSLEKEIRYLGNKERFVQEVIDNDLNIMNVEESKIIKELKERDYDEDPKKEESGYDYLLNMQVRTFTADRVKKLKDDIASNKKKLEDIKKTNESKMWINDLDEFVEQYEKWLKIIEKETMKKKGRKKGKK